MRAWHLRLSPAQRRICAASDRIESLAVRVTPALRAAVAALPAALAGASRPRAERLAQVIVDEMCLGFGVPPLRVRVMGRRPAWRRGELHGLYTPAPECRRDIVQVWMITARRGQVVAVRTFLRTLLHEVCHHLDYTLLRLRDSFHTDGFYKRESSLFRAITEGIALPPPRRKPSPAAARPGTARPR